MPHCYQVNDNTQTISDKEWKREDFGLPADGFVFCSFNQTYKIEPALFDTWARILLDVPKSVLWLLWKNETAERNLKREIRARGVEPQRLVFAKRISKSDHLARMGLADLFLDTWTVNGHTTTSDALWAGVPVITKIGTHFASRVAASILTAIGLPELITSDPDGYRTLAVRLAKHPDELEEIRRKIERNRLTTPLFDTRRFARDIENALGKMWETWRDGNALRGIET